MKFNVEEFKEVLRKATLNFSIESVRLELTKDKIKSDMISERRNAVAVLDIPNNMMALKKSAEYEFNFSQPNQQLIPFLKLIDEEEANISVKDNKIILSSGRQRSNIHFCSPDIVSVFEGDVRKKVEYFLTIDIDDIMNEAFAKIKKIGTRFGDVYFNVDNGIFNIETSDRTNRFSNGLKFDLVDDLKDVDDLSLRFDLKNFLNLMAVVNGSAEDFQLNFSYIKEEGMGMLLAEREGETEKYYLMSHQMEDEI